MTKDYTTVTEKTGNPITRDQLFRQCNRYYFAARFCEDKDVLEVACGSGQGLGYLAQKARWVVGGDYTRDLIRLAQTHYQSRVPLARLDAHALPFEADRFDVVLLYEAIYYLHAPDEFLDECRRVLRPGGIVLIATANKDWSGFAPSPFSTQYFSAPELHELLSRHGFDVELLADFPVAMTGVKHKAVALLRRAATSLNLMPKTMKGKEHLKRIFYGKLTALPGEIEEGMIEISRPLPVAPDSPLTTHKVLYAVARARRG